MKRGIVLLGFTGLFLLFSACVPSVPQEEAIAAWNQMATLASEKKEMEADLSDQAEEIILNQEEIVSLQDEFTALQIEYDELDDTYQEAKTQLNRLEVQLEDLQCDEKIPNMTYSDIFNSSTILSAWMADQSWVESVQGSYRDSIRNDVDSKIHAIRYISSNDNQPHVEHFVVYFDELGWEKGVFWIAGQCWLDK